MNEDFAWFINHYVEFQHKYGNSFIVIKNKQILGVYDSFAEGVKKTLVSEKMGTFIVQECSVDTEAYNMYIASMNFM